MTKYAFNIDYKKMPKYRHVYGVHNCDTSIMGDVPNCGTSVNFFMTCHYDTSNIYDVQNMHVINV
jgi:hypothetical protein